MSNHKEWLHSVMTDEQYEKEQKTIVLHSQSDIAMVEYADKYKPEYDEIAHLMMQDEDSTLTRVCVALKVTDQTLRAWQKRHPSFRIALETGRLIGEEAFRAKILKHAFSPSSEVNNGLIKMIAKNAHGISDDTGPTILIQNNQNSTQNISKEESALIYADMINKDKP